MAEGVEFRVEPSSGRFDADDDRWLGEVADFFQGLRQAADEIRRERTPVPGTKGALDSIVVSLTSAGALTATVEFIKAWLGRDSSRRLRVAFGDGGQLREVEFSGAELDAAALNQVTHALEAQLGPRP